MNRRSFLKVTTTAGAALLSQRVPARGPITRTQWVVRESEGFDALSFLSPMSGDPFYLHYYKDAVAAFEPRMPRAAMAMLKALLQRAQSAEILLSPFLDLRFSAASDRTIEDLLASAADPDGKLLPAFRASPYWDESDREAWPQFRAALPALASILEAMKVAGFGEFRERIFAPKRSRIESLRAKLA